MERFCFSLNEIFSRRRTGHCLYALLNRNERRAFQRRCRGGANRRPCHIDARDSAIVTGFLAVWPSRCVDCYGGVPAYWIGYFKCCTRTVSPRRQQKVMPAGVAIAVITTAGRGYTHRPAGIGLVAHMFGFPLSFGILGALTSIVKLSARMMTDHG